jgi:hypothetical protein
MVKFLKKYLPWGILALLTLEGVAGLIGVPFLGHPLVTIVGIIGWVSYIEIAQFD